MPAPPTWSTPCARPWAPCSGRSNPTFSSGARKPIRNRSPLCDGGQEVTLEPLRINRKRLLGMFRSGVAELEPVLKSILSPPTLAELQRIAALGRRRIFLWRRTLGPHRLRIRRFVSQSGHQPRPHRPGPGPALSRKGIHLSGRKPRSLRRASGTEHRKLLPDMRTSEAVPAGTVERKEVRSPCGK